MVVEQPQALDSRSVGLVTSDLGMDRSVRLQAWGGGPQEDERAPAHEVGGHSHFVAGVSGTGCMVYCSSITPIDSPRSTT